MMARKDGARRLAIYEAIPASYGSHVKHLTARANRGYSGEGTA
jgi:hypothetical protein